MTAPPASASLSPLQHLRQRLGARYTIERELGRGGMGTVYLCRDVQLDRLVALKVLPAEFAVQPTLRDRFLRETRTAAGFSHPNIVPVYAVEESDDLLAYAMGYVEGESLTERVRRVGPLNVRDTVKVMQDVAYALAYAHGRGIVHRDVKPDNIMIERASGRALVMDFGIARAKSSAPVVNAGLTRVGEVVGTPEYMSPEQACGDDVDGRSDLYSLGLTMIFAVTGKNAVQADSTQKVLMKQLTVDLPAITTLRADLPDALAIAIDRCVMKNPADRFETAESLVEALDQTQLVSAEIPVAIRGFQQDVNTLSVVVTVFVLASAYMIRTMNVNGGDDESLLIIVLMFAVAATRALQTFAESRRLALAGFLPEEISDGMGRVMDEREERRSELRADPGVRRARRNTVVIGVALLVLAVVAFRVALSFRHRVRPGYYQVELPGVAAIMTTMASLGVGMVLLLKSPLRMPLGERLFRAVWLGPVGRALVRFSARNVRSGAGMGGSSATRARVTQSRITQAGIMQAGIAQARNTQSDIMPPGSDVSTAMPTHDTPMSARAPSLASTLYAGVPHLRAATDGGAGVDAGGVAGAVEAEREQVGGPIGARVAALEARVARLEERGG